MHIIHDIATLRKELKGAGSIGFVPTMGALHEGHMSLVRQAKAENDLVVVSIFVNPTQFSPSEDLDRYPKTLEADTAALQLLDVEYVFAPSVDEMYPQFKDDGSFTDTHVVPGDLAKRFEGELRPGHFEGVALVVSKLLNIVNPTRAYFGEKDYQQLLIIKQMVADLNINTEIVACPIVREESGLARSSRNSYFTQDARLQAGGIYQAIQSAQQAFSRGERDAAKLCALVSEEIKGRLLRADSEITLSYIDIVDAHTLTPLETLNDDPGLSRILVSLNYEGTHLIDNASLSL